MKRIVGILVVVIVAWLAWAPLSVFLFGGRLSYANTPKGDWVGEMQVTPSAFGPKVPGLTVDLPHPAAIRFSLDVTDAFMDEYGGPGELYIAGEPQSRMIRMGAFRLQKKGVVSTAITVLQDSLLFGGADGSFEGDTIQLRDDDMNDLKFTATLHRGGTAEYEALVSKLRRSAPSGAVNSTRTEAASKAL